VTEGIEQTYDRVIAEEKLKSGTKYERLTAIVFKILDESGLVVHDVRLRGAGKEARHQIDVSASYGQGPRRVLVECKDYDSESVGIGIIRDFNGALIQLQPAQGIVVTTTQFTPEACAYARDEGIALVQLRPFTDRDWDGRARAINITATGYATGEPQTQWEGTGRMRPAPAAEPDSTGRVSTHEASYYDESGARQESLHSLLAPWHREMSRTVPMDGSVSALTGTHQLDQPVWLMRGTDLVEVTGFTWTVPVASIDFDLAVTGSRIADLVARAVQLPDKLALSQSLVAELGSPSTVIFQDQLARWSVDDAGVITPRRP
jgi:hypothetical protein